MRIPTAFTLKALLVLTMFMVGQGRAWAQKESPAVVPKVAAAQTSGSSWASLTRQQQAALAPLKGDWDGLDAPRKAKWLDLSKRFEAMPAAEQKRVQARMAEWARLSPNERAQARLQYQQAREISPQERQAKWQEFQSLGAGEKQALLNRAAAAQSSAASSASKSGSLAPNVPAGKAESAKIVGPTVVQAKPGVSTNLISQPALSSQAGKAPATRIVATPAAVDRLTLLPKRGPQSAATHAAAPASQPTAHP